MESFAAVLNVITRGRHWTERSLHLESVFCLEKEQTVLGQKEVRTGQRLLRDKA